MNPVATAYCGAFGFATKGAAMFINTHFRRLMCLGLMAISICIVFTSACWAVSMDAVVGFDGEAKSGVWTPIAVRLSNADASMVEGELMVSQPSMGRASMPRCSARVNLPANSTKVYRVYLRLNDSANKVTVSLAAGRSSVEKIININPTAPDDELVVSVGNQMSRLNFLANDPVSNNDSRHIHYAMKNEYDRNYQSSNSAAIRVGSIAPNMLPDRPAAYSGVDVMVVSDLTAAPVSPKALKAICMWVASGGMLVVSANANYKNYSNDFFDEMLPVRIIGSTSVNNLSSLSTMGSSPFPQGAISTVKSELRPETGAAVIASEQGVPIVVERKYGAGKVVFLAIDHLSPAFRSWNGQVKFWKGIVTASVADRLAEPTPSFIEMDPGYSGYYPEENLGSSLGGIVAPNASVKAPSFDTIGLYLIAYFILLVPVNYFLLKRKRKLEMAWASTPMIVAIFSLGAYGIGYSMKSGGLQLQEAAVVEGASNCRYASMITDSSIFSPARRSYDIEVSDPYCLGEVIRSEYKEQLPDSYVGEKSVIEDVGMAMWSNKFFETASGTDLGGVVSSDLTMAGNRIQGNIKNNTPIRLRDCMVLFGNTAQMIGDLNPGDEKAVDITYSAYNSTLPSSSYSDGMPLSDRINNFAAQRAKSALEPVLIAKSDMRSSSTFNVANANAEPKSITGYIFRLGYRAAGQFTIPGERIHRSMVEVQSGEENNSGSSSGAIQFSLYNQGYATIQYHLPLPASSQVTKLTIHAKSSSGSAAFNMTIYNTSTGSYDAVKVGSNGSIPNPSSYITTSGGVRVKVHTKPGKSAADGWIAVSAQGKSR